MGEVRRLIIWAESTVLGSWLGSYDEGDGVVWCCENC